MIVVDMDASTVSRIRFAPSPVAEAVSLLRLTAAGRRDPVFGDPGAGARSALSHRDVALVAEVMPAGGHGYLPDFLTPKPPAGRTVLEYQIDAVAGTEPAEVDQQVRRERYAGCRAPAHVARLVEDGTFASRVANGLRVFWRAALADSWSRLAEIPADDAASRSREAGAAGLQGMLNGLHPDIEADGRSLRIRMPPWEERGELHDTELVLSPAVFGWPHVSPQLCRADQAVVRYPARGLGGRRPASRRRALTSLLGATRSDLLGDLTSPRSTSELAARHRLSRATVSYHLQILHECGLVRRARDGHSVLYERTERADALVGDH